MSLRIALYLVSFSALTALFLIGQWMLLQLVAPKISETAEVLRAYPDAVMGILLAAALAYLLKALFD